MAMAVNKLTKAAAESIFKSCCFACQWCPSLYVFMLRKSNLFKTKGIAFTLSKK